MPKTKVVHRRYSDARNRDDLKALALCNNINGPLPRAKLTGKDDEVTCGRCKRIMNPSWKNPPSRPFSNADMRRISRDLAPPKRDRALPALVPLGADPRTLDDNGVPRARACVHGCVRVGVHADCPPAPEVSPSELAHTVGYIKQGVRYAFDAEDVATVEAARLLRAGKKFRFVVTHQGNMPYSIRVEEEQ